MALRNTNYSIEELDTLFKKSEKIFFVGVGGISMSSIARFCVCLGKEVYGYDKVRTPLTERLEKEIKVKYCSTPDNIKGMDMVVYTNAIEEKNYEIKAAKRQNIPVISRANFLGYLISLHKVRIGISGTHGKSTTTSMLAHVFHYAEENPTVFCGAEMIDFNTNYKFGSRAYCIFEACEYQNSFLCLPSTDAVVLNLELDHPDFFKSLDSLKDSFRSYIKGAKRVFLNCDCEHVKEMSHSNTITFGFCSHATYRAEICDCKNCSVSPCKPHRQSTQFKIYKHGIELCTCTIPFCGKHLVYDALCAFAVAHTYGIPKNKIVSALSSFKGVRRRMEFLKKNDTGADIFEDYAHHPTEIHSSLSALSDMGYKRIMCVFQPHTFSRTHYLYERFTEAFSISAELIIAPTFFAREENVFELSEENFAQDCGGIFIRDYKEIKHRVANSDCDAIVLMGAGDLRSRLFP